MQAISLKAKGNRPKTIEAYQYPLRRLLLPFCTREGVSAPTDLNVRLLDRLAVEIHERGLSPHSVSSYVRPSGSSCAGRPPRASCRPRPTWRRSKRPGATCGA